MKKRGIIHWDLFAAIFLIIVGSISTVKVAQNRPWKSLKYSSSSFYNYGEVVTIAGLAILALAVLMLVGGLLLLWKVIRRIYKKSRLMKEGIKLIAVVSDVKMDVLSGKNRSHFYYLECTWTDELGRETRVFRSENTFNDYSYTIGTPISVYFNPDKPAQYFVDIESIEL